MATMFRVALPDGGPATVSTSVSAFSTCAAGEIALIVGSSVPLQRCGSELRSMLEKFADQPKDPDTGVGGTNRKTYLAAPGVPGDQLTVSTQAQATAPTETQWGIVVGDTAASYLDRSNLLDAFVHRVLDATPAVLGQ
jgi:hypothetical protein